jgi:catechol 2,3-dioxygenase-like lactoylglutathione lyase family enzyme
MPKIDHLDLVVSSIDRSLPFYRDLLRPLGWRGLHEAEGERGETIYYLWGPSLRASLGLRERQTEDDTPVDRYRVGVHHVAFPARSRRRVDERARWLDERGATIETGPKPYRYTPGYYAVFFYDPDGIKLEIVHRPLWRMIGMRPGQRGRP